LKDRQAYDQLDVLMKFLTKNEVELRHLSLLKASFKTENVLTLPVEVVHEIVEKIFGKFRQSAEIIEKLMSHLAEKQDETSEALIVSYSRICELVDFVKH